jgi:hypothetical protein
MNPSIEYSGGAHLYKQQHIPPTMATSTAKAKTHPQPKLKKQNVPRCDKDEIEIKKLTEQITKIKREKGVREIEYNKLVEATRGCDKAKEQIHKQQTEISEYMKKYNTLRTEHTSLLDREEQHTKIRKEYLKKNNELSDNVLKLQKEVRELRLKIYSLTKKNNTVLANSNGINKKILESKIHNKSPKGNIKSPKGSNKSPKGTRRNIRKWNKVLPPRVSTQLTEIGKVPLWATQEHKYIIGNNSPEINRSSIFEETGPLLEGSLLTETLPSLKNLPVKSPVQSIQSVKNKIVPSNPNTAVRPKFPLPDITPIKGMKPSLLSSNVSRITGQPLRI